MLAHQHTGAPHGRRRARQRGETLIELLVTVAIVGIAFAAIIGAVFTATKSARVAREKSQMAVALQRWADATLAPVLPTGTPVPNYATCGPPPSGTPVAGNGLPAGWSAHMDIRYLQADSLAGPGFSWSTTCSTDRGLQEITLTVTGPTHSDHLIIYKRDPRCPSSFDNADLGPC